MNDAFLKPPSLGIWMTFGCALCIVAFSLWPHVELPALGLLLILGAIAFGAIARWLGRCIGYAIGRIGYEFMEGFRESRNKRP